MLQVPILLNERLEAATRRIEFVSGETLFRTGDASRGMFILDQGRVRLIRHGRDGAEITLHNISPGESFAEPSLFTDAYHCDCLCDQSGAVKLVPRQAMLRELERDAAFSAYFVMRLAGQVRDLRTQLELRNIRSAEERVINALTLRLKGSARRVNLTTTLKAFASEIGLTHEVLYRTLRKLEQQERIKRTGRAIELPD